MIIFTNNLQLEEIKNSRKKRKDERRRRKGKEERKIRKNKETKIKNKLLNFIYYYCIILF